MDIHHLNSAIYYLNSLNKDQKASYFLEFLQICLKNCKILVSFRTYRSYNQLHIQVIKACELYTYINENSGDLLISDIWISTPEEIVNHISEKLSELRISD